jgi:hypothetical protein
LGLFADNCCCYTIMVDYLILRTHFTAIRFADKTKYSNRTNDRKNIAAVTSEEDVSRNKHH